MGSTASKVSEPELNEKLVERLRALQVEEYAHRRELDEEFVHVVRDGPGRYDSDSASSDMSVRAMQEWEKELLEDPKNCLALAALSTNSPASVLTSRAALIADTQTFNVKIPLEGAPITNQRASGRCWLFASTNVFRVALMRRHGLKEFELSQAYLFFWDKIEKANYFLEQILDTVDEDLDGRLVQALLGQPVSDGGQWDMVANLVEKYGLVPQVLYPDSWNAMNSGAIDSIITTKLREDALDLRRLACRASSASSRASLLKIKEQMVRDIHRVLTLTLGPPPSPSKEFTWEYYDADEKFHRLETTPLGFARELSSAEAVRACGGTDVHRLFSLVNDPRNAYGELLSVSRLGNIVGGRGIRYVNVDMATIKAACIAQLRRGIPIFFGSDVGKYSNSQAGVMDTGLIDYELGFNVRLGMKKAQRLQTRESAMTHAMVLTAVHVVDGRPVRWRVQNSWGTAPGSEGW